MRPALVRRSFFWNQIGTRLWQELPNRRGGASLNYPSGQVKTPQMADAPGGFFVYTGAEGSRSTYVAAGCHGQSKRPEKTWLPEKTWPREHRQGGRNVYSLPTNRPGVDSVAPGRRLWQGRTHRDRRNAAQAFPHSTYSGDCAHTSRHRNPIAYRNARRGRKYPGAIRNPDPSHRWGGDGLCTRRHVPDGQHRRPDR